MIHSELGGQIYVDRCDFINNTAGHNGGAIDIAGEQHRIKWEVFTNYTNGFRLTVKSASGTSNAGNKAYNMIALYRKDCIFVSKGQERMLEKFVEDCAKCGFDFDDCDGFLEVVKTKGNGNGVIGLVYDRETKTYKQARKISATEADKIFKTRVKQSRFDMMGEWEDDDEIPFE